MYKQFPVVGPWQGIVTNLARPSLPPNAVDDAENFLFTKGKAVTRPKLIVANAIPPATGPADQTGQYITPFMDINGGWHNFLLASHHAYFITLGVVYNSLGLPGGLANLGGDLRPFATANILNRLYFNKGISAAQKLMYVDGSASVQFAGDATFGARFLAVQGVHLIAAHVIESDGTVYPFRVRWSKSGDPNSWYSVSAGFNDLINTHDEITGLVSLGRNTYIYRRNGLSVMYPSNDPFSPFNFENLTYAPVGVGISWPYATGYYADSAVLVAEDDIYLQTQSSFRAIGGKAKKGIFASINAVGNLVTEAVRGWVITRFDPGYDYLSYWLSIGGANPSTWIYHYDEDNWTRFNSASGQLTCIGSYHAV